MAKKSLKVVAEPGGNHDPEHGHEHSHCSSGPSVSVLGAGAETRLSAKNFRGKAAVVTLGCAKNHVDSEVMLGVLKSQGFQIVSQVEDADVAIVNTCGFLQSAVQESIDCILDIADLKKTGRLRRLVVTGCAVERYTDPSGKAGDIREALPEVDAFLSGHRLLEIAEVSELEATDAKSSGELSLSQILDQGARPYFLYDETMPRELATARHTAYVKIGEGCNRPCTFCIIPKIRGVMRSRSVESVVREVQSLSQQGVREFNLVAQDLTSYGLDLRVGSEKPQVRLTELLKRLDAETEAKWIRLLYAYPIGIDKELLRAIEELPSVVEYLDLPLQHASEKVLQSMRRPLGRYAPRQIIDSIRQEAPSISLRTTFIVGFPGETEADVDELEAFIRTGYFTSVGIFTYSPEPGTPAYDLSAQVPEKVKAKRRERLMQAQQEVLAERLQAMIGQSIQVLIEGPHEDTELLLVGRARFQAPEVDGTVIINDVAGQPGECQPRTGEFAEVEITEVAGYDLVGRITGLEKTLQHQPKLTQQEAGREARGE